jgi:hypothetical protein
MQPIPSSFLKFPWTRCPYAVAILLASSVSFAGANLETNLVYADLGEPRSPAVAENIRQMVVQDDPKCWNKGQGKIYIKERPSGITDELLTSAILANNLQSKKKLSELLLWNKSTKADGFDGAIVYVNKPFPRFVSFTAKTLLVTWDAIGDIQSASSVEKSFCVIKPDIVRPL